MRFDSFKMRRKAYFCVTGSEQRHFPSVSCETRGFRPWLYACKRTWSEGWKVPSGRHAPAGSQLQLRRREAGWGVAGDEPPVRSICEPDSAGSFGEPAA